MPNNAEERVAPDFAQLRNAHLDLQTLSQFASGSLPLPHDQAQPVDALLANAWQVLLDAGIVVDEDGNPPGEGERTITVEVNQATVLIGPEASPSKWSGERLPPLEGTVYSLACALLAIVCGEPDPGAHPWPHH